MKKYKSIIVDDERKIREVLRIKLQQFCKDVEVVATATNSEEAYQQISFHQPHIVFLDISMPGESGFELLNRFDQIDFEIIFITGYDAYALDALKVSAVDYLLKPVSTEDLIQAVNKAKKNIQKSEKIKMYHTLRHNIKHMGEQETRLAIPEANFYEFVEISEIIRCEGWQKYTRIYLKGGREVLSSYNIGIYRDMLKSYSFYSTHKSHLINTKMIARYSKNGIVIMVDGSEIPVARRKKEEFIREVLNVL